MANQVYDNIVIGNKVTEVLETLVDLSQFVTIDTDLVEQPGMTKKINTYSATGDVEDLAMGSGNTDDIEVSFSTADYDVVVTQGRFAYYDEQAMTDPMVVEVGINGAVKTMVNDFTDKAVAQWETATIAETPEAWSFDAVVDAIAALDMENEEGLSLFISPADKAAFRKALADDLKYSEGFARTGYIGSVCGVPVVVTKAVPADKGYLATKEAVTLFIKKDSEIEQERSANTRQNTIYVRKATVVALTDATKVAKITITPATPSDN